MSSNIFADSLAKFPQLSGQLHILSEWLNRNSHKKRIDPRRVVKEMNQKDSDIEIVYALSVLASKGLISSRYQVEPLSGGIAIEEVFTSPFEVPESLIDGSGQPFSRDNARIVPIFLLDEQEV